MTREEILVDVENNISPDTHWVTTAIGSDVVITYDPLNPNYIVTTPGSNITLNITGVPSGKGGMVLVNRAASEIVTPVGEVVVGNFPATGKIRFTYLQEPDGLKWFCNNATFTGATDITFTRNDKGIVYPDRTNGNIYRVFVNNGAIGLELVTAAPPATPTSGFTPLTIAGTIGWYDPTNTASFNPASPSTWNDLSNTHQNLSIIGSGITVESFAGKQLLKFNPSGTKVGRPDFVLGNSFTAYMVVVPSTLGGSSHPYETTLAYDYSSEHFRLVDNGIYKLQFINNGTSGTGHEYILNREPTLVTVQVGGGSAKIWINNVLVQTRNYSPDFGPSGALSIGSEAFFTNSPQVFSGYIGDIVFRNTLDDSSIQSQFRDYFKSKYDVKTTITTSDIWCFGDSRTSGHYVGQSYPSLLAQLVPGTVPVRNVGAWGKSATGESAAIYADMVKPYAVSGNILLSAFGANDLATAYTGQQWIDAQQPTWDNFRSKGGKVFVLTVEPRSDKSTAENQKRLDYNALLPALVTNNKVDGYINTVADARLNDPSNTTYFLDGVHLTQLGDQIKAQLVYDNISTVITGGAGYATPAAPTLTADDTANTLSASHALGTSEIVVSENNGAYLPYSGTINVGDTGRAVGYWKFKIKAAANRNESAIASSPAFTTAAVAADPTIPIWRNVLKATANTDGTLTFDGDRNSYGGGGEVSNGYFTRGSKYSFVIPGNPQDIGNNKFGLVLSTDAIAAATTDYSNNANLGSFRLEVQSATSSACNVWWEGTAYPVQPLDVIEISAGADGSMFLKKTSGGTTTQLGALNGGFLTGNFLIRAGIGYTGNMAATPKVYKVRVNSLVPMT